MTSTEKIDWKDGVSVAIIACCLFEMGMNGVGGYDLLGGAAGGLKAKVIAMAGVCVAVLGTWAGYQAMQIYRQGGPKPVARTFMIAAAVAFLLSQALAWRVLSSTFADGALRREVAGQSLQAKRDELKAIGVTRAKGRIEADLDLELRRTSKQFPNGDGPKATALKGELATVVRKERLEAEIASAGKAGGQMVAAGSENMIAEKVLGVSNEDSLLAIIMALSGLIGFCAYFGFALRELARGGGRDPGDQDPDPLDDYYRSLQRTTRALPQPVGRTQRVGEHLVLPQASGATVWPSAGGGEQHLSAPSHAAAPVTINIGGMPVAGGGTSASSAGSDPVTVPLVPAGDVSGQPAAAERVDLPALPPPARPVDRSAVAVDLTDEERPAADVILSFRAACVIDAPSGLVSSANLFRRYEVWAGDRALAEPAFLQLFPRVTGIRLTDIGGFLHAVGVALRAAPALRNVA